MNILGIETSCDETAVGIVKDGTEVLSNVITSSLDLFKETGGVIPEEAARQQLLCIQTVLEGALHESKLDWSAIDAIAVTKGPGLKGSLIVGTTAARMLASIYNKPLIGVHHTLGHLSSVWLNNPEPTFPCLTLSVSGGHTDLWYRTKHTNAELLGKTLDDAAGEAFDKGAALLGLTYPGGPAISKAAESGNEDSFILPKPLQGKPGCNFSYSGLKTALKVIINNMDQPIETEVADVAASYQAAIGRHLLSRLKIALEMKPDVQEVHIVGGVSANTWLREKAAIECKGIIVRFPKSIRFCTDNAAMIASAGYFICKELGKKAYEQFTTGANQSDLSG